ncbi:transmembrane protein 234 homolog [Anthonomus grandis grandis]|uniref:transmembrane protein 234 homolog n=1 Tax=Anthonomus grandis grandis TaxID=2921223 RepID=UPI00216645F5|nr:transmembrane protein 234 homolog [Anthonomus grandis grandis]
MLFEIGCLICVAMLWGFTNPMIKKNSQSITKVKAPNVIKQFLLELKYLATNLQYLIPMAFNQTGSILYIFTLQNVSLTLASPLTNTLTFIFTAIADAYLEKTLPSKKTLLGVALILFGTFLCCYSKGE